MKEQMMNQTQAAQTETFETIHPEGEVTTFHDNDPHSQEQQHRAAAYSLLAALLRNPPDQVVLERVAGFSEIKPEGDELALSMSMLGLSASNSSPPSVDDEFHALFIGLGRGELVPYGTWYQTGFLMERPLSVLRDDLKVLGFERDSNVHEPEDHVAALCEVMAMLIMDGATQKQQSEFFDPHIGSWFERFFSDLAQAKSATFYKSVGRFGAAFTALEKQYLAMQV